MKVSEDLRSDQFSPLKKITLEMKIKIKILWNLKDLSQIGKKQLKKKWKEYLKL